MQAFTVPSAQAMLELGEGWARRLHDGAVVFLCGDLGAGKTTLVRGILHGMGHRGAVLSPTYTLVEGYSLPRGAVYHVDLYRLEHADELEMIGVREWLDGSAILLIEWPERGMERMPAPNFRIDIHYQNRGRRVSVRSADGAELPPPC